MRSKNYYKWKYLFILDFACFITSFILIFATDFGYSILFTLLLITSISLGFIYHRLISDTYFVVYEKLSEKQQG